MYNILFIFSSRMMEHQCGILGMKVCLTPPEVTPLSVHIDGLKSNRPAHIFGHHCSPSVF